MKVPTARRIRVDLDRIDALLNRALERTYAARDRFENESDFKFELYYNLHGLRLDGHMLGRKLPGYPTCLLHAEAKPVNGNPRKADLLICNPSTPKPLFNYRTEVVIELKKTINARAFHKEVDKFISYRPCGVRRLYVIAANSNNLGDGEKAAILKEHGLVPSKVIVYDRATIHEIKPSMRIQDTTTAGLKGVVSACIEKTLLLYGKGRHQYHGFFWCNYEHEENKGWTFPAEGDFNAQLYHLLRTRLPKEAKIQTEFKLSQGRCDFFISCGGRSVGIEVKMNWDQFRHQPSRAKQEVDAILDKFAAMRFRKSRHSNLLVVIQGHDGFKSDNRRKALRGLSGKAVGFELFCYDEERGSVFKTKLR